MAFNRRTALRAVAALAAAQAAAAAGGADATPADPIIEEVAPPAIVEDVKTPETPADDLYQQIDKAYEDMKKGEEPTIVVTEPEKKDETPVIDEVKPDDTAPVIETPSTPVGGNKTETVDKADENDQTIETPAEAPATGNTAPSSGKGLTPAQKRALARLEATKKAQENAQNTPSNGTTTPVTPAVRPGYGTENKFSEDANWGDDDQAKAVKAFLDEHPTGSAWDDDASYKNFAGCSAYAFQLMDIAYDGIDTTTHMQYIKDRYQVRQYDVIDVGGHDVFVLEVLPEQNAVRTAEGNFNDKTFNEGIYSMDHIYGIFRPELAA